MSVIHGAWDENRQCWTTSDGRFSIIRVRVAGWRVTRAGEGHSKDTKRYSDARRVVADLAAGGGMFSSAIDAQRGTE